MTEQRRTLHAIGNAHIDPVWLWRWPEGLETIRATFRSALDRMNEYPEFTFTCSSSAFYSLLAEAEPQMLDEIRERVRQGRWEVVGGWWVEPDTNIPCGESLLRQGLYGQRALMNLFGVQATIGYNPDTFGHPGTLPQLLRTVGLTRYVFMRPGTHEKALPEHVFRWRSLDGSEVLAARIARSYATWREQIEDHVRACAGEAPTSIRDYVVFYGVGNHGGGPTRANIESLTSLRDAVPDFEVRMSSLSAFFDSAEADLADKNVAPLVEEELQYHARGCYSAHSGIKRWNRRAEHLLMSAERFAAMAEWTVAHPYPGADLATAWQALLFTQFHDILAGTSLPEAYRDARDAIGFASHIAGRALHGALQAIGSQVDTRGPGNAVLVFNPLPWAVRGPIEIERGAPNIAGSDGTPIAAQAIQPTTTSGQRRSCFVADLPALGYGLFMETATPSAQACGGDLIVSPEAVANDWWRIDISAETGLPAQIVAARLGAGLLVDPGMSLVAVDDDSDTWSHGVAEFRQEIGRFTGAGAAVVDEAGPVRAAVRTHSCWRNSQAVHWIRLYRDVPVIEGELRLVWRERLCALKLAVPTGLVAAEATYEVPYGFARRPANGEEQPGQQWADITGRLILAGGAARRYGVALANDCKYGYDALDAELRLTLVRSPAFAHHDPRQLEEGVEYQFMDQGEHIVRYRLIPHADGWEEADVPRRAMELNVPPIWVNEYAHRGPLPATLSFLRAEPSNIAATVCKRSEDGGGLIVRCVETCGRGADARIIMPTVGVSWRAHFAPLQLRTFCVRRAPQVTVHETDGLERASEPPLKLEVA